MQPEPYLGERDQASPVAVASGWFRGERILWVNANPGFAVRHWQVEAHLKQHAFHRVWCYKAHRSGGKSENQP